MKPILTLLFVLLTTSLYADTTPGVTWDAVQGADGYKLYRRPSAQTEFNKDTDMVAEITTGVKKYVRCAPGSWTFAVTAYVIVNQGTADEGKIETDYSNEVLFTSVDDPSGLRIIAFWIPPE